MSGLLKGFCAISIRSPRRFGKIKAQGRVGFRQLPASYYLLPTPPPPPPAPPAAAAATTTTSATLFS